MQRRESGIFYADGSGHSGPEQFSVACAHHAVDAQRFQRAHQPLARRAPELIQQVAAFDSMQEREDPAVLFAQLTNSSSYTESSVLSGVVEKADPLAATFFLKRVVR